MSFPVRSPAYKFSVIVSLLFIAVPGVSAQRVGLRGGLVLSTLSVENSIVTDFPPRAGFALGVVVEVPIASGFHLQLEPSFVQRGTEIDWGSESSRGRVRVMLDYIVLPIMAKFTDDSWSLSPYIMAGPSLGLIVTERSDSNEAGEVRDDDSLVKDFNATAEIEAGIRIPLNLRHGTALVVGARYSLGLTDISRSGVGAVHTRGVLVLATILLQL